MTNVELDNYISSFKATTLGLNSYLDQYDKTCSFKKNNWLALGGEDGEGITLDKISTFLGQERIRLNEEYQNNLQNPEKSDESLARLAVDLIFLEGAERVDSFYGRQAAKRYFLKQLAYEWYQFRYNSLPALVPHSNPDADCDLLGRYYVKCARSALYLL